MFWNTASVEEWDLIQCITRNLLLALRFWEGCAETCWAKQIILLISTPFISAFFAYEIVMRYGIFAFGESTPFFLYYEELISSTSPLILAPIQQYLHRSVLLQKRAVSAYQTIP